MRQPIRNVLILAAFTAAPVLTGCSTSDDGYVARREPLSRPSLSSRLAANNANAGNNAGPAVAKDIPLFGNSNPGGAGGGPADPTASQLVDTTGIRVTELPSVQRAMAAAGHWQRAVGEVEARVDAPDLKRNLREGMAVVAPRVARALIDYKGETAIVTVAVYRDANPAPAPNAPASAQPTGNGQAQGLQSLGVDPTTTPDRTAGVLPATQPAPGAATTQPAGAGAGPSVQPSTQPAYKHAAVAIAFEGFAGRLDPSFIPRVLADQPRTPDDGREPIDPNLVLDREATGYVFFRSTRDGLVAAQVTHDEFRRELADAADRAQPATRPATTGAGTRPGTDAAPRPGELSGPYNPLGTGGGGGVGQTYDNGEPRYPDGYAGGYYDDGYGYPGGYYGGPYYDPYLYDLYGSRWGSPYFITRSGFYYNDYYWGSPWYRHHHHHRRLDRDDDGRGNDGRDDNDGRGPIVVRGGGTRGTVPWGNPPIVSATNPPRQTAAAAGRTGPTPRVTPAVRGGPTPARDATPASRPPLVAPSITGGRPTPAPAEFVGPRAPTDSQRAAAAAAADSERAASDGRGSADGDQATFRRADGDTITFAPSPSSAARRDDDDKDDGASRARPAGGNRLLIPPARAPQPAQRPEAARRPHAAADNNPGPSNGPINRQLGSREISPPRLGNGRSDRGEFVGPRALPRGGDPAPSRGDSPRVGPSRVDSSRGDASPSRGASPRASDSASRGNSAARTESGSSRSGGDGGARSSGSGSRGESSGSRGDSGGSRSSSSSSSRGDGGSGSSRNR